jgi:AcrR family transcriptional regulator
MLALLTFFLLNYVDAVNMKPGRYHHGNLREALVDAALAILREKSLESVGLREVARQIGVSTAAPYRHFANRDALLTAVAAQGFRDLASRLTGVANRHGPAALAALGQAYVSFAMEHRNLFEIMLRGERGGASSEELQTAGRAAFQSLETAVNHIVGDGSHEAALGAWSLVHGLSILAAERQLPATSLAQDRLDVLVRKATETFELGLRSRQEREKPSDE